MSLTDPASALEALDRSALAPFREAWEALEKEAWDGMAPRLSDLARIHLELMERHGLSPEAPPADPWTALAAYRQDAATQVQAPFLALLRAADPMKPAGRLVAQAEERSWASAGALAPRAALPWDDGGLRAREADRMGRRTARALVRGLHRLRSRAARPPVPMRNLAHHVLRTNVVPAQREAFAEAQRAWAAWTSALERDWDTWAGRILTGLVPVRDTTAGDPDDDDLQRDEAAGRAIAAITALQQGLDRALAGAPHEDAKARGTEALRAAAGLFAQELPLAGTVALRLASGSVRLPAPRARSGPSWTDWYGHALNRFELHRILLQIVLGSEDAVRTFEARVLGERGTDLTPACAEASAELRKLAGRLRAGPDLAATLVELRPAARANVGAGLDSLPHLGRFEAGVGGAADALSEAIHGLTRGIPAELVLHDLPESGASPLRPGEPRPVRLQEICRRTFDVLRMEKIRTSPLPVVSKVAGLTAAAAEIHEVVVFGFDSAEGDLEDGGEDGTEGALTLVREGLERAADALDALPDNVDRAIQESCDAARTEVTRGWARLVDRGLAQGVQSQILDARSTLRHEIGAFRERWAPTFQRARGRLGGYWKQAREAARVLVRRGRTMVGASGATRASYRVAKTLAQSDVLYATLPLVYQRLYSLKPVADPALLVARDRILSEIEERCRAWRDEDGIPLVLYGHPGVGMSSLFLILAERLRATGTRTVHAGLDHRFRTESALAAHLAETIGLPASDSLDGLTAAILAAPKDTIPDVVALEGLEHLYLRIPGGTDLIERLLTLVSETEPRVFWIASATHAAWQLVRKAEPTAVSQVEQIELSSLRADEVREAVLARHRRSGVPFDYEEPTEGRHLLRRRLRRIQGSEARREVLEQDFFENLHQASGGNIRLALFHWLRAADFASVPGELRVRPVESVDFSFLDGLDLTQNFTLKALLEHRTLTLQDHDAIFRLPRQESFQIMESLMNRFLVEPVGDPGGEDRRAGAEHDQRRYRIRPLLAGAVSAHLAGRNIVH
jgi:hypothetical protein